jgi:hypothetical protein
MDKNGRPLLSWRVAILPYIEQEALYGRFHLDEPWDSPHNLELLKEMPPIYAFPDQSDPAMTYVQAIVGPGTPFEPGGKWSLSKEDFLSDDEDATILIIEAGEPVPWTKPDDVSFDPMGPLPALGGGRSRARGQVAIAGKANGATWFLEEEDRERLPRLFLRRERR